MQIEAATWIPSCLLGWLHSHLQTTGVSLCLNRPHPIWETHLKGRWKMIITTSADANEAWKISMTVSEVHSLGVQRLCSGPTDPVDTREEAASVVSKPANTHKTTPPSNIEKLPMFPLHVMNETRNYRHVWSCRGFGLELWMCDPHTFAVPSD